jgi:hypothetical protein
MLHAKSATACMAPTSAVGDHAAVDVSRLHKRKTKLRRYNHERSLLADLLHHYLIQATTVDYIWWCWELNLCLYYLDKCLHK